MGDPVEMRYKESQERGTVINQLGYCINSYREAAASNDAKFDHIDLAEKEKVIINKIRNAKILVIFGRQENEEC